MALISAELAQLEEDEDTFADADDGSILPTVATKTVTSEGVTVVTLDAAINADENSVEQSAKVLSDLFVRTLAKVLAEEEEALAKKAASTGLLLPLLLRGCCKRMNNSIV